MSRTLAVHRQEMKMTAPARRLTGTLRSLARAALLGALLWPAPAALAQGTTTFDINVPRRTGGRLPLSRLKVTVTLASNGPFAFEVTDHARSEEHTSELQSLRHL